MYFIDALLLHTSLHRVFRLLVLCVCNVCSNNAIPVFDNPVIFSIGRGTIPNNQDPMIQIF